MGLNANKGNTIVDEMEYIKSYFDESNENMSTDEMLFNCYDTLEKEWVMYRFNEVLKKYGVMSRERLVSDIKVILDDDLDEYSNISKLKHLTKSLETTKFIYNNKKPLTFKEFKMVLEEWLIIMEENND